MIENGKDDGKTEEMMENVGKVDGTMEKNDGS